LICRRCEWGKWERVRDEMYVQMVENDGFGHGDGVADRPQPFVEGFVRVGDRIVSRQPEEGGSHVGKPGRYVLHRWYLVC
jgi:hypothetical protein